MTIKSYLFTFFLNKIIIATAIILLITDSNLLGQHVNLRKCYKHKNWYQLISIKSRYNDPFVKGSIMIGGTYSLKVGEVDDFIRFYGINKFISHSYSVLGGIFLRKNFAIGASIGYEKLPYKIIKEDSLEISGYYRYKFNAYGRRYLKVLPRMYLILEGTVNLSKNYTIPDRFGAAGISNMTLISLAICPIILIKPAYNMGIEFSYGGTTFTYNKAFQECDDFFLGDGRLFLNKYGFNYGLSETKIWTVSYIYYFKRKEVVKAHLEYTPKI